MDVPELNCSSQYTRVSWAQDDDAVGGVVVTAVSEMGHKHSCKALSGKQSCDLPDLRCGLRYTVRGVALGSDCDSVPSRPFNLTTGVCKRHTETHIHMNALTQSFSESILYVSSLTH